MRANKILDIANNMDTLYSDTVKTNYTTEIYIFEYMINNSDKILTDTNKLKQEGFIIKRVDSIRSCNEIFKCPSIIFYVECIKFKDKNSTKEKKIITRTFKNSNRIIKNWRELYAESIKNLIDKEIKDGWCLVSDEAQYTYDILCKYELVFEREVKSV